MVDREKVIRGLWCCKTYNCTECPYLKVNGCIPRLYDHAIAMIREQEPVKPKRESRAMLPCKCGCKRREHWFAPDAEMPEELRCCQCRFTVRGKNQTDVIRQWNKAVSGND